MCILVLKSLFYYLICHKCYFYQCSTMLNMLKTIHAVIEIINRTILGIYFLLWDRYKYSFCQNHFRVACTTLVAHICSQ